MRTLQMIDLITGCNLFSVLCLDMFFLLPIVDICSGLVNVSLLITPLPVQRGKHVTLLCQYDLQGAALYSVKWYRGRYEFYRYLPSEVPSTRIFPFPGINVDVSKSNENCVVLREVGFSLAGNLTCEVTTDAPEFITAIATKLMTVIYIPDNGPTINPNKLKYSIGDRILANCSSSPSKPPAILSFYINRIPINSQQSRMKVTLGSDSLWKSTLAVDLILLPSHFEIMKEIDRKRSEIYRNNYSLMSLACTAVIGHFYRNTTELGILFGREPKGEKVSSMCGKHCAGNAAIILELFTLLTVLMFSR